ncbi:hypothetical protein [Frankia sp. AgKG'84/4]|uniref:hypothetical protein n=1 Tax=Frankia sp. AgKG'84/4 TaxID=573490 RepID=UPI00200F6E26|nr:hypothetical protein [Frankia sp. AgKG'84/4]MCL9793202.1 hypothetical protein [Frankia sp. AgKG'84/4]
MTEPSGVLIARVLVPGTMVVEPGDRPAGSSIEDSRAGWCGSTTDHTVALSEPTVTKVAPSGVNSPS